MVAMDMPSSRPVERGDLSLALAGAELIDLLGDQAVRVDGGRIVPGSPRVFADPLLDSAGKAVVREGSYEEVGEWLWRRGRGLADAYLGAFESEGLVSRERERRWVVFGGTRRVLVDSAERHRAASRWRADDPVLADLATGIGVRVRDERAEDVTEVKDDAVATVLIAVTDALAELGEERERRARKLEDAAETNYRRGF